VPRNLVVCCDGTGNEFGDANSNAEQIYSLLILDDGRQVAYYHPGVGTMGAPNALLKTTKWFTRVLGLGFGYGITADIEDAYEFLMDTFEPEDRVFVFGFSRGAYTARALCSMLRMYGLVRRGDRALVRYASRMLRHGGADRFRLAAQFKATFSRPCQPYFVGVWDTVKSIGWITNPVDLPYTSTNKDIQFARHAVSIDERRCFYRTNLWQAVADPRPGQPPPLKQVWFAGVHSDVGGSYPAAENGLSKIALRWMLAEAAEAGLILDPQKASRALHTDAHDQTSAEFMVHRSLKRWWWPLEYLPKRSRQEQAQPDGSSTWITRWALPRAKPRTIAPGSLVHQSVVDRIQQVPSYRPINLPPPPQYTVVDDLPSPFPRVPTP
jgi:uncharacterized protein (DUF2235 family)